MTCVENVAYAIRLCLENEQAIGKVYNVTNGEPREFKQILEQLFTEIGHKPKYLKLNFSVMYTFASCLEKIYKLFSIYSKEPIFTRYTVSLLGFSQTLNIERIREDLGYEPIVTLDEGIKQYAKANR
jgi:dTDP-4-dehydrorhamnose 3,5-epimerase